MQTVGRAGRQGRSASMTMTTRARQARPISAADAAALVRSGDWLDYGATFNQPDVFDAALALRLSDLADVKIRGCLSTRPRAVLEADPSGEHFAWFNWHFGGYDRRLHDAGICHYIPCNLGEIPDYYRRFIDPVDVLVLKQAGLGLAAIADEGERRGGRRGNRLEAPRRVPLENVVRAGSQLRADAFDRGQRRVGQRAARQRRSPRGIGQRAGGLEQRRAVALGHRSLQAVVVEPGHALGGGEDFLRAVVHQRVDAADVLRDRPRGARRPRPL